jgi:hypothetical protein
VTEEKKKQGIDQVFEDLGKLKNVPDAIEKIGEFFNPLNDDKKEKSEGDNGEE